MGAIIKFHYCLREFAKLIMLRSHRASAAQDSVRVGRYGTLSAEESPMAMWLRAGKGPFVVGARVFLS